MALISCKECGKSISSEAKTCPQCGAKCSKPISIIGIVVTLIFCVMVFQCNSPRESPSATPDTNKATKQKAEPAYNPVAKWGAEKVAAANKVMAMVKYDCNVFEDNGDLVVEMHNHMDDRNTLLNYVRAIANTDVILHGAARNIYYYDPSGKKIAKADTTYGVRLEN